MRKCAWAEGYESLDASLPLSGPRLRKTQPIFTDSPGVNPSQS